MGCRRRGVKEVESRKENENKETEKEKQKRKKGIIKVLEIMNEKTREMERKCL